MAPPLQTTACCRCVLRQRRQLIQMMNGKCGLQRLCNFVFRYALAELNSPSSLTAHAREACLVSLHTRLPCPARIEKENKKKVKAKKTKNQTTRGMLSLRTNSASFGNDEYDRIITPTKTRDKNVFFST